VEAVRSSKERVTEKKKGGGGEGDTRETGDGLPPLVGCRLDSWGICGGSPYLSLHTEE
jgi:hypothetical protein